MVVPDVIYQDIFSNGLNSIISKLNLITDMHGYIILTGTWMTQISDLQLIYRSSNERSIEPAKVWAWTVANHKVTGELTHVFEPTVFTVDSDDLQTLSIYYGAKEPVQGFAKDLYQLLLIQGHAGSVLVVNCRDR